MPESDPRAASNFAFLIGGAANFGVFRFTICESIKGWVTSWVCFSPMALSSGRGRPRSPFRWSMVADVAAHALTRHAPDLFLIDFLSTGSFRHLYGPRSPEAAGSVRLWTGPAARTGRLLPAGVDELAEDGEAIVPV